MPLPLGAERVPVAMVRPSSSVRVTSRESGAVVPNKTPNPERKAPLTGQTLEGIAALEASAVKVAECFSIRLLCAEVIPVVCVKSVHDPAILRLLCYIL